MTREEKLIQIEELTAVLNQAPTIYLADIAALDADTTSVSYTHLTLPTTPYV